MTTHAYNYDAAGHRTPSDSFVCDEIQLGILIGNYRFNLLTIEEWFIFNHKGITFELQSLDFG